MKLKEIMALDKELSKADVVTLYRAYIPEDGKQIDLSTDGAIMYLNIKDAIQGMLNTEPEMERLFVFDRLLNPTMDVLKSSIIAIVKISIPVKNQKDKSLMTEDLGLGYNPQSGSVVIELNNFDFQIDVEEISVKDIAYVIEDSTEIKKITHLTYDSLTDVGDKKKKK